MSGKETPRGAATRISSGASPALQLATSNSQTSSILKSAFTPSYLQLTLFASVIQAFDSQHLRIHDTKTGRLQCEHAIPGSQITSLGWGCYGSKFWEQNLQSLGKKRKRDSQGESGRRNLDHAVVAFGTSNSDVCMFSPAERKVTGTLSGPHERGIKDFRFCEPDCLEAWSLGGDGKLVHWDLRTKQARRIISLPDSNINILAIPANYEPQVLCASLTPYAISITSSDTHQITSFDSFKHPVRAVVRSGAGVSTTDTGETFLAADNDRYINIYDITQRRLLRSLTVGSEVEDVVFYGAEQGARQDLLAVTTRNGLLELFPKPFQQASQPHDPNGDIKSIRKTLTKKATALLKFISPDARGNVVPVVKASIQGPNLVLALAEGGLDLSFQKVRWQDEGSGELLLFGVREIIKAKIASTLNTAMMNGIKDIGKQHVDESRTIIVDGEVEGASQAAVIQISSGEDNEESDESDEEDEDSSEEREGVKPAGRESVNADVEMADESGAPPISKDKVDADRQQEDLEPTFGELLASKTSGAISIADALGTPTSGAAVSTKANNSHAITSGLSLSTILTQSLRTNDQNLLESCFHNGDTAMIRLTIQRLESSLAGILLQKLAERLSSRPGRYGTLLVWVQWICVAHGGAIAGHPDVLAKLKTLLKVLTQRSRTLDSLLLLKGKLDMLDAQIGLRRHIQAERGSIRNPDGEEDVIYIEGQEEDYSTDEDGDDGGAAPVIKPGTGKKSLEGLVDEGDEAEDGEDMPMVNGVRAHSDIDEEDEETDEEAPVQMESGLIDEEAEESDEGSQSSDAEEPEEEDDGSDTDGDSEMDGFINDGPISEVDSASEIDLDEIPKKPSLKKKKRN